MDTVVQQLELKYAKFLENRDHNTRHSFEPAYEYLVIVETQPRVKEIIEKDRLDLDARKHEVTTLRLPQEDYERMIKKIDRSSLSFCYSEIYRDVYIPMTKFKTAPLPLTPTEIIGSTKLFREKSMDFVCAVGAFIAKHFYSATKKEIDGASAMLKIEYTFTQRKYDTYMERIHAALIPQLLEICTKSKEIATAQSSKYKIIVSETKGIYQSGDEKAAYSLRRGKKRFKLIKHLLSTDDCKLSELEDITNQDGPVIIRAIADINRLFRQETGLTHDLILHNDTIGYHLNKRDFEIVQEK